MLFVTTIPTAAWDVIDCGDCNVEAVSAGTILVGYGSTPEAAARDATASTFDDSCTWCDLWTECEWWGDADIHASNMTCVPIPSAGEPLWKCTITVGSGSTVTECCSNPC